MKVYFKNDWFSPRGTRYRKHRSYELPDEWADLIPTNAEALEDSEPGDAVEPELIEKATRRKRKTKTPAKEKVSL